MKKSLFIDFDGTICFDRFWASAPSLIKTWINQNIFQNETLVHDWMKGYKTSEEINKYISNSTKYEYSKLWEIFVKKCREMTIEQGILAKIKSLSKSYTTILITDNMDSFRRFTLPSLKLNRYFDQIEVSTDYNSLKTDKIGETLFEKIADKYKINLKDAILIDNSKRGCSKFEELGGKSIITDSAGKTKEILEKL